MRRPVRRDGRHRAGAGRREEDALGVPADRAARAADASATGTRHSQSDRSLSSCARLAKAKLAAAAEADRRTLLRRLKFDLLGLPPTPEEVDAFVGDTAPNAYERLVDRLLASPHFGERWARHWLDVVRFAESDGFETNLARPNAWPYRDYVIAAFNADKPYDRFVMEQLAGDALGRRRGDGLSRRRGVRQGEEPGHRAHARSSAPTNCTTW